MFNESDEDVNDHASDDENILEVKSGNIDTEQDLTDEDDNMVTKQNARKDLDPEEEIDQKLNSDPQLREKIDHRSKSDPELKGGKMDSYSNEHGTLDTNSIKTAGFHFNSVCSKPNEQNRSTDFTNPKYSSTKDPVKPSAFNKYCFQEPHGPTSNVNIDKPSDIFQNFMSDDIMQKIVAESNKYAKQNGTDLALNVEELKSFIGLLIIMGFHSLLSMRRYWSTDPNFSVPRITNVMTI
ncbi:hypothetical protein JTB14_022063 [Gonioctena quinquepunctata]|nr:hypothetical protein JTB14_022063 [Gonioctena quinquepunctata]